MYEKWGYPIYWIVFTVGLLSYIFIFTEEYGFVYPVFLTFMLGGFNIVVALSLDSKRLILLSLLLMVSPYMMFLFIYIL